VRPSAAPHCGHAALLSGAGCHSDQGGGVVGRLQAQKCAPVVCIVLYPSNGLQETNTIGYITELFGGDIIEITQDEYRAIQGKTGLFFLKRLSRTINIAGVKQILPKKDYLSDEMEERRSTQKEGVLHDGRKVIKHFGVWYHIDGDYDDRGNPLSRPYEKWYPEVARDCIPTVAEYHQLYAHLPKPERLKAILTRFSPAKINGPENPEEIDHEGRKAITQYYE
jgi:hypothetical protein